jgi:hypothetical protein
MIGYLDLKWKIVSLFKDIRRGHSSLKPYLYNWGRAAGYSFPSTSSSVSSGLFMTYAVRKTCGDRIRLGKRMYERGRCCAMRVSSARILVTPVSGG